MSYQPDKPSRFEAGSGPVPAGTPIPILTDHDQFQRDIEARARKHGNAAFWAASALASNAYLGLALMTGRAVFAFGVIAGMQVVWFVHSLLEYRSARWLAKMRKKKISERLAAGDPGVSA